MKTCIGALGALLISFLVVSCGNKEDSSALFTVGGVVSGSTGTLVLQNNGSNDISLTANGPFAFPIAAASGSPYSVTVRANPAGQTCIVSSGTGTIFISNITNVSVNCSARGGLDVTFNSPNGFATMNDAAGGDADDAGNAVTVDPQDRVLVAGRSMNGAGNTDMVVWRFTTNGTPDTTFNASGFVVHDNAAGGNGDDSGNAVALASGGGILVTGSSTTTGGATDMVVWRFAENGALDTSFNGSGMVVHDGSAAGSGSESGNAIVMDVQGRVLVSGITTTADGTTDMVIWRYNANGTVDTGLNKGGMVVHNSAAGGGGDDSGNAIAVDASNRIVVAGSSRNSAGNLDMVVWRYKNDGTLDTSFNSTGIFVHGNAAGGNGDDSGRAIAVDALGRILVAGSSKGAYGTDMVVWRLTSTGTLDSTFGVNGIVINNGAAGSNGDDAGSGIRLDSQGRIIVAGKSTNTAGNTDMVVWRLNADGTLDSTFADYGILGHDGAAGGSGDDSGNGVSVDSHDRILVGGSSGNSAGNSDMAVWRVFP